MRFDSGDELQEVLLAEGAAGWRNATKRHEDEAAQFGGVVANPDARKSRGMWPAAAFGLGPDTLIAHRFLWLQCNAGSPDEIVTGTC